MWIFSQIQVRYGRMVSHILHGVKNRSESNATSCPMGTGEREVDHFSLSDTKIQKSYCAASRGNASSLISWKILLTFLVIFLNPSGHIPGWYLKIVPPPIPSTTFLIHYSLSSKFGRHILWINEKVVNQLHVHSIFSWLLLRAATILPLLLQGKLI